MGVSGLLGGFIAAKAAIVPKMLRLNQLEDELGQRFLRSVARDLFQVRSG